MTGVMEKSDKEVASLRINLTYGDMNRLFFQNIASLSRNASDDALRSFSTMFGSTPYDSPYNADGSLNNDLAFYAANPLYEKNLSSYIRSRSGSFIDTFRIRWTILSSLRVEASFSYTQTKKRGRNLLLSAFETLLQRMRPSGQLRRVEPARLLTLRQCLRGLQQGLGPRQREPAESHGGR